MTVGIYVNTSKQAGDKGHLKDFATERRSENDPEGLRLSMR